MRILETYRNAFRNLEREVWILSLVGLVNRAGTMVLPFLTLYLRQELSFTPAGAGLVLALYGVGGMAGTVIGGKLVDRIGYRPLMIASLVASGAMLFVLGFVRSRPAIELTVVAFALVSEAFRPACSTAVSAFSRPAERARAYGLFRLAINAGFTIGPAIGGLLAAIDYGWLFWFDGASCLLAALFLARLFPKGPPPVEFEEAEVPRGTASPWRDRVFVVAFVLLLLQGLIFFQTMSTFSLFLKEQRGLSEPTIGLLFAVNTAIIVVAEMVLVQRVQGRNPLRVVAVGCVFLALGFGLLPWAQGVAAIGATVAIWTVGEMLSAPLAMAWIANRASAANRGRYLGAAALCFAAASVLAPLIGTGLYERVSPDAPWFASLGLGAILFAGFWWLARRGSPGPAPGKAQ